MKIVYRCPLTSWLSWFPISSPNSLTLTLTTCFFVCGLERMLSIRESCFLVDEKTTPVRDKYNIANTIAHELSHMWFGNLVTMKWWTDLWLNEGFATYVTRLAVQREFPEWNAYNFEVTSNLIYILALDALSSSHPVSVPIGHPNEICQIFDHISYSKGAFLLYMMNGFLGDTVFRKGVNKYLRQFSYQNSETDDLWSSLTKAAAGTTVLPSGQTVKSVMDSWTSQTGYPLVTVRRDRGRVFVSQKRFLAVQPKSEEQPRECWWIPLTFSTASNSNFNDTQSTHWLGCDVQELVLETGAQSSNWIVLNNKANGLYRVNYDQHSWSLLVNALHSPNFTTIHELNRVQLVLDAMSLAKLGLLEYSLAFKLLLYIRKERAYNPWRAADSSLREIEMLLWRTERFHEFKKFAGYLVSKTYKEHSDLTAVPEGFEDIKKKEMIVKLACDYQVGNCFQKADQLFKDWMSSGVNTIPKDLRSTVYCVGVKNGGQSAWNHVWNQYHTSNIANEKNVFLRALACTENNSLLTRYLTQSIDQTSGIRRQDADLVFVSVAQSTKLGYRLAQKFLVDNIQRIYDYLAPNTRSLGSYIAVLTRRMVFPEEVVEMKKFVTTNRELLKNAQMEVNQALELAESNIKWMERFYSQISKALVV
uniref:Aminopeptidase N n=1 Tax=Graphocephala atropunctata TaxID=36148 RepID=A0A1B6LAT7_9HEMI